MRINKYVTIVADWSLPSVGSGGQGIKEGGTRYFEFTDFPLI